MLKATFKQLKTTSSSNNREFSKRDRRGNKCYTVPLSIDFLTLFFKAFVTSLAPVDGRQTDHKCGPRECFANF